MYFGKETYCERVTDLCFISPTLKVFLISASFFLIMSFPVQASLTPLFLSVLGKSLSGCSFVLCKSSCLKSPIFLLIWILPPSDCSLFLSDTQKFTVVTPSHEDVVMSLGHSNHTVKIVPVKAHASFETRRQHL